MSKSHAFLPVAACALLLAACGDPEPPAQSEAEPAGTAGTERGAQRQREAEPANGGDPIDLDPDHYTVELENDAVRVLRITYGPGEESVMHAHPESVAVFLTDLEGEMTTPDGSIEEVSVPAGTASYSAATEHRPKNTSDSEFELIEIELKPGDADPLDPTGPDPVEVDPDHYTTEFENDAVRILRITYGPGEESVMHYHPQSVAVFLTGSRGQMTLPDGSTEESSADAGDVTFNAAGQHLPETGSDSGSELILVELK